MWTRLGRAGTSGSSGLCDAQKAEGQPSPSRSHEHIIRTIDYTRVEMSELPLRYLEALQLKNMLAANNEHA